MGSSYKKMITGLMRKESKRRRKKSKPWHLYILKCADGTLYTGITNDVNKRFAVHQSGKGAKFTRTRLPVMLAYQEPCRSRSAALIREYKIKSLSRKKKEELASLSEVVKDPKEVS